MNNNDRAEWIDNLEPLYNWYHGWRRAQHKARRSKEAFIRDNKPEIDRMIQNYLHPHQKEQSHGND